MLETHQRSPNTEYRNLLVASDFREGQALFGPSQLLFLFTGGYATSENLLQAAYVSKRKLLKGRRCINKIE